MIFGQMPPRRNEHNDRKTEQFRKLFIGGLPPQTTEETLKHFYSQWGELVDCVVMKDPKTKRSRGFGFVTFKEPEQLDSAQNDRPHVIDQKTVETKRAMPREDSNLPEAHMTTNKLFVGALKRDVQSEDLRNYFCQYGNITDCEVVTDKNTGNSRGFGFVTFEDYDSVDKIILFKPHEVKNSRTDVRKALSREQMNEAKKKQASGPMGYGPPPPYGMHGGPRTPMPPMGHQPYAADGYGYWGYGGYDAYGSPGPRGYGGGGGEFGQYGGQNYAGGPMRHPSPGNYRGQTPYNAPGG
ncbi:hypothetical protein Ciccas_000548 [Cichlidogyrus casuarinus]|uniref:RRM domain-containing protein n=1 Tax=Cichlidogyrus casuarinus TaxID=1844966 RepID=A0ABD2QMM4_9PLAT